MTSSRYDVEPFHFPVKPNAIDDERERAGERRNRAGKINGRAFDHIDPNAPAAHAQREQRRENHEYNMESFE
jgi:hypothetical protein